MRKVILKLALCFLVLIVVVLVLTIITLKILSTFDMNIIGEFMTEGLLFSLVPALLAMGYFIVMFHILKNYSKWQMVMILKAIIVIVLSIVIAQLAFTTIWDWLTPTVIFAWIRSMVIISFITIALSFLILIINKRMIIKKESLNDNHLEG